jgi:hypothetical protein
MSVAVGACKADAANNSSSAGNSTSPTSTNGAAAIDQAANAKVVHEVLKKLAAGEKPDPALMNQFVNAQNADVRTGPKPGQKVPEFTLPDQNSREHSLRDLMGANGLLLVFVRSADW